MPPWVLVDTDVQWMEGAHAAKQDAVGQGAQRYRRHRPERTLLYQVIERHYPAFVAHLANHGKQLPAHIQRETSGTEVVNSI